MRRTQTIRHLAAVALAAVAVTLAACEPLGPDELQREVALDPLGRRGRRGARRAGRRSEHQRTFARVQARELADAAEHSAERLTDAHPAEGLGAATAHARSTSPSTSHRRSASTRPLRTMPRRASAIVCLACALARGSDPTPSRIDLKKLLQVALGILAAIGGFVDIGDLVFTTQAGAAFGYQLVWAVVLGVMGIVVFAEMSGRVAAVTGRPVLDVVRQRLGFGVGLATLIAAELLSLLTLTAEVGGLAVVIRLFFDPPYPPLVPSRVGALMVAVCADALRVDRAPLRLRGPVSARLRSSPRSTCSPDWAAVGDRLRAQRPGQRVALYALLRRRPDRRRADALRGLLLFLGSGRGGLDGPGSGPQPAQRGARLRARRPPVDRPDLSPPPSSSRSAWTRT